jgi:pathogenesis-related protein 1
MRLKIHALTISLATLLASQTAHASDFDPAAFITEHNKWRAYVGVTEELRYSAALANRAQAWADHLRTTQHCRMRHSRLDGRYGENLYWASAVQWSDGRKELQSVTPEQVVDSWGEEMADYDYQTGTCAPRKVCDHYTQVVWRSTETLGCGMAICEDTKEQVWACQYEPAGNLVGEKPY